MVMSPGMGQCHIMTPWKLLSMIVSSGTGLEAQVNFRGCLPLTTLVMDRYNLLWDVLILEELGHKCHKVPISG